MTTREHKQAQLRAANADKIVWLIIGAAAILSAVLWWLT